MARVHLLPCLDLASRLASRGHRVSFVSTPHNIARLPPVRPAAAQLLDFVALPLPRVDGLPDGAESTNDVPHELLWTAFDGLAAPFAEFLGAACADDGAKKPDWAIVDIFHHWAAAAAVEHKVPCAMLFLSAANNMASWSHRLSAHAGPAATAGDEQAASVQERPTAAPRFESERAARLHTNQGTSGMSVAQRCSLTLERCTLVAMRSCLEWEPEPLPLAAALGGKSVVPFGLLPPSLDARRSTSENKDDATVRWLDAQPANSVVYALGSEASLRVEQVHELALGLELAGTRFLSALRKPSGVVPNEDMLPPGFQERTRGHGLVTMGWVPQVSVLAHEAVGAFLTHCGWSSVIEGLLFGQPLIMLPIFGDQGPNARLMEGKKVGLQVPRDESDGSFDREGVASTVRAAMAEDEARRVFAANAKKLQEIVRDGELHESYIYGFVRQLRSYKK